jgi:hypothetical protein
MKIHIDENGDVIRCFGNVKPGDTHTLSTIRAVDEEIIGWLERREAGPRGSSSSSETRTDDFDDQRGQAATS